LRAIRLYHLLVTSGLTLQLLTAPALGETSGISGVSGMNNGLFCSNAGFSCHSTEDITREPTVRFEGPAQLDPGAVGTYRFVVESNAPETQIAAGLDVAASGGTLLIIDGQQTQILDGELTHTGPKDNDANGDASWQFQWQAPTQPGTYMLFGAGNSVDFFGSASGDQAAITVLQIAVGVVAATPTATAAPTATVPPPMCAGDCDGNATVAINELIVCVNIALEAASVDTCAPCDTTDDGIVSVNDLIAAVGRIIGGC
jgi:hypothetical protein